MPKFMRPSGFVQTVRSVSSPRCRSEAQATLLVAKTVVSSEAVASRTGGAVSPHGLAMKRVASSSGAADVRNEHRTAQAG